MSLITDGPQVGEAGWEELTQRRWIELVQAGLPSQLADLARDASNRNHRPVGVFSLPMAEPGICGVTPPFMNEDWLLFDPSLEGDTCDLARVIAGELAQLLYPGWTERHLDAHDEIDRFAAALTPTLLERLPRTVDEVVPVVERTMCSPMPLRPGNARALGAGVNRCRRESALGRGQWP